MDKKEAIQCIKRLKYEIDCKHALMQNKYPNTYEQKRQLLEALDMAVGLIQEAT